MTKRVLSDKQTAQETINYFNLFSRPLSLIEIKNLSQKKLSSKQIKSYGLKQEDDYFYKTKGFVRKFLAKQDITSIKRRKLDRIAWMIRFSPFVRGVFGSGSLALHNAKTSSDLDIFVITSRNRIYTTRFFLTGLLFLIGQRRTNFKQKDRVCLNHFLSEEKLIPRDKNLYTARLYSLFYPLIEKKTLLRFQKKNVWITKLLPNYPFEIQEDNVYSLKNKTIDKFLSGRLGDMLECVLKKYQLRKLKKNPEFRSKNAIIISTDQELAFHPHPQQFKMLGK